MNEKSSVFIICLEAIRYLLLYNLHGCIINSLSTNHTKWLNTLKKFIRKLPTNCLSVFDHFVKLVFKGLSHNERLSMYSLEIYFFGKDYL